MYFKNLHPTYSLGYETNTFIPDQRQLNKFLKNSWGFIFLGALYIGRVVVPTPKKVMNLSRTYEKENYKRELYRFSSYRDHLLQTNRHTNTDPVMFIYGLDMYSSLSSFFALYQIKCSKMFLLMIISKKICNKIYRVTHTLFFYVA